MASIFSKLPNNLIIKIIRIDNDRRKCEKERILYEEVIYPFSRFSLLTYKYCSRERDRRQVFKTLYYELSKKLTKKEVSILSKPKIEKLLDWELFMNSNRY